MNDKRKRTLIPIPLPGYEKIEHFSSSHNNKTLFLLASKEVPLSAADEALKQEIDKRKKEVYGAMKKNKKSTAITVARVELRELLERQRAYDLVRLQEAHGLFIGNYRRLQQAEILGVTSRRGELESLEYAFRGVEGKLMLPVENGLHEEPVAVHGKARILLKTLPNRTY